MTDRFTCAKCGFRCSLTDLQDRGGGALHCPNCVAPTGVKRLEACPVPDDRTPEKDAAMLRVAGDAPNGMDAYCERNAATILQEIAKTALDLTALTAQAADALAAQGVTLLPHGRAMPVAAHRTCRHILSVVLARRRAALNADEVSVLRIAGSPPFSLVEALWRNWQTQRP